MSEAKSLVSMTSNDMYNQSPDITDPRIYEIRKLSKADLESKVLLMEISLVDLVKDNKELKALVNPLQAEIIKLKAELQTEVEQALAKSKK